MVNKNKVLFSICVICKDEATTLPRLIASLKQYQDLGGEICVMDTNSTDGTPKIARELGCKVKEVGEKFMVAIDNPIMINKKFVVEGEKQIVKKGDRFFNFSAARNECAKMATNKIIFWYDADEVNVRMDIDKINAFIKDGSQQFEYFFTFAYDAFGAEAVKFVQCKAYDKTKMNWTGCVHELVTPLKGQTPKRTFLPEDVYKLGHHQNFAQSRHSYIIGLAYDCFHNFSNDRHVFYLSRELKYNNRPKSAVKLFKHHMTMGGWLQERAQSAIHIGDIMGGLGQPNLQAEYYSKSFYLDSSRNEALIHLAQFYRHNKNWQAAICFAKAALEIPYSGFYADTLAHYREVPHEIIYVAAGFMGRIEEAQIHLLKCLSYQPHNQIYLRDTRYYFEYAAPEIDGWMKYPELTWLYETAKKYDNILEGGSWKGRSTHAICSGCNGTVTAVDTWLGSDDTRDDTHWLAKKEDVFEIFKANTKQFKNLTINRKSSVEAAKDYPDKTFDCIFIDMGHTKPDVLLDIKTWIFKVKETGMICGHDYLTDVWMGVIEAVDEIFGKPDGVCDTIWYVDLSKKSPAELQSLYDKCRNSQPPVNNEKKTALQNFTRMIEQGEDFTFVKMGDGEMISMLGSGEINGGKNIDGSTYFPELGPALIAAYRNLIGGGAYFGNMFEDGAVNQGFNDEAYQLMLRDYKAFLLPLIPEINTCERKVPGNIFLHQKGAPQKELFEFYSAIRNSKRRKIFIGPSKLKTVSELFNAEFIEVSEVDAFLEVDRFSNQSLGDGIVLISAGMAAKVIINKLKISHSHVEHSNGVKLDTSFIDLGSAFDPLISNTRTNQLSTNEMNELYKGWFPQKTLIPKKIFTCWLSEDGTIPPQIQKCIDSQKIDGYEHILITLDWLVTYYQTRKMPKYVHDAIVAKKWVKVNDILRMIILEEFGGLYLDADVEVLPNMNYNSLLHNKMFAAREENGFVGYSLVGSVAKHPLAEKYLSEVTTRFSGSDNLYFESSMEVFTHLALSGQYDINILPPEYFFPWNHQTGLINVTDKTISFHHFCKSWKNTTDLLPTVSILIPQLGRPDGLKRILKSIDQLYYPKHLIETIVIEGKETVPKKMVKGLKKSKGEIICYMANDTEMTPWSLYRAVKMSDKYGLVAFNTGEPVHEGNVCEHFTIKRNLIQRIGGQIFDTRYTHLGVDQLLWAKCSKLGEAFRDKDAIVIHNHFSTGKSEFDEVYAKVWNDEMMKHDRELLCNDLKELDAKGI